MKDTTKICAYLLAVLFLGCLFAPLLYWMLRALERVALANGLLFFDPHGSEVIVRGPLAFIVTDFQRCFNRAMLVAAIVLLWPTARWIGATGKVDLQLRRDPRRWEHLTTGFIVAGLAVLAMGIAYIGWNVYHLRSPLPWGKLPKLALGSITVACLEEALFRGAILGLLLRSMKPYSALFWTTSLFAILHFLKPSDEIEITHPGIFSGFQLLPYSFHQFAEPMMLLAGFATLFTLGWVLGYARLRTDALWMSIGLHAGVVFVKMGFSKFTKRDDAYLPWIGPELQIGLVPVVVLLLVGFVIWKRLDREELLPDRR